MDSPNKLLATSFGRYKHLKRHLFWPGKSLDWLKADSIHLPFAHLNPLIKVFIRAGNPFFLSLFLILAGTIISTSTHAQKRGFEVFVSELKGDFSLAGCGICEALGNKTEPAFHLTFKANSIQQDTCFTCIGDNRICGASNARLNYFTAENDPPNIYFGLTAWENDTGDWCTFDEKPEDPELFKAYDDCEETYTTYINPINVGQWQTISRIPVTNYELCLGWASYTLTYRWYYLKVENPIASPTSYLDGCCRVFNPVASIQEHVTWYWQDSPTGTSTDHPTNQPYTICSSGPDDSGRILYIRARGDRSQEWSTLSVVVNDGAYPAVSSYASPELVQPATNVSLDACQNVRVVFREGGGGINCQDEFAYSTDGGTTISSYNSGDWVKTLAGQQTIIYTRRICENYCTINTSGWSAVATWNVNPDNTAPLAICKDRVVSLDASGKITLDPNLFDGGSTDACGIDPARSSLDQGAFTCSNLGVHTLTLTVYDVNGNSATCQAQVDIRDSIPPDARCQDVTVQLDAQGKGSVTPEEVNNGSSDACGEIVSMVLSNTSFDCSILQNPLPSYIILTITDQSGNSSTCASRVTVQDTIRPVALCKATFSTTLLKEFDSNSVLVSTSDLDAGSYDNCSLVQKTLSQARFYCADVGTHTVTLTVSDQSGNSSTCQTTVTIDDEPPLMVCKDITVDVKSGPQSITPTSVLDNYLAPSNFSWCHGQSPPVLSLDRSSFSCSDLASSPVLVTVSAVDYLGRTSSCQANVQIIDSGISNLSCGFVNVDLQNGESKTVDLSNLYSAYDFCGIASLTPAQTSITVDCDDYGQTLQIPVTASDVNGNQATCNMRVIVRSPYWANCKQVSVELDENGQAYVPASDIADFGTPCSLAKEEYEQTLQQRLLLALPPYPEIDLKGGVTYGPADAGKNYRYYYEIKGPSNKSCFADVSVIAYQGPTALCQDITVELDESGQALVTPEQVDGGSFAPLEFTLSLDKSSFTCNDLGTNTVTLTAFGNNRSSTCEATVTVEDNSSPGIFCKNATIQLDANGVANLSPDDVLISSTDNCVIDINLSQSVFDCNQIGTHSIDLTASDQSGNSSSCQVLVTVEDTIAPLVVCENITVALDADGEAYVGASQIGGNTSDNCIEVGIKLSQSNFDCSHLGDNTVTLTAKDDQGNASTCTAIVTVIDTLPPILVCRNVTVYLEDNGTVELYNSLLTESINENCSLGGGFVSPRVIDCTQAGQQIEVSVNLADASGNFGNCTSIVTVLDTIKPSAVCKSVVRAYLDADGQAMVLATDLNNGSNDNCGSAALSLAFSDGTTQHNFDCQDANTTSYYTLTVVDASGNVSTCLSQILVLDTVAPIARCKDVTIGLDVSGKASYASDIINNGSSDNCGNVSFQVQNVLVTCANLGSTEAIFTATDASGNTSSCTGTISIVDKMAPKAICQATTIELDANGNANLTPALVDGGSSDNCGIDSYSLVEVLPVTIVQVPTLPGGTVGNIDLSGSLSVTHVSGSGSGGTISLSNPIGVLGSSSLNFGCTQLGDHTIMLNVVDAAGNSSSCTTTVSVKDTRAPQAICQDITVYLDTNGLASITPVQIDNGSSDNCGITGRSLDITAFTCDNLGSNQVTLSLTDASGNSSFCLAKVTVVDDLAPGISCPANITKALDRGECETVISFSDPVIGDNCSAVLVKSKGLNSGDLFPMGVTVLSFKTIDPSGNTASCSFSVTLTSNLPDKDKDGIVNQCDNCPQIPNADQADFDGDGVGDLCDVCQGFDDTIDADANGVPDCLENGSDPCATGLVVVDTDGDGIDDNCDICPKVYNPDQLDTDHDGVGDACDNCVNVFNSDQKDTDHDGIGDACDNCKKIFNPDQADRNGNGIGDVCEKGKGGNNLITSSDSGLAGYLNAFPNPFNSTLSIRFKLPEAGPVKLQVFSLDGRLIDQVYQGKLDADEHQMEWNAGTRNGAILPSGVYLLQLTTEGAVRNHRIVLQR